MKYHAGFNNGSNNPICGRRGLRNNARVSHLTDIDSFIRYMITNEENCCEHCKKVIEKKLPNKLANYRNKH